MSAAGIGVHGNRLRRADRIGGHHVARAAVGGQRRVVHLNRLPDVNERRARRRGHRPGGAGKRADAAQHAVAGRLHQFVEERAELLHAVGYFALGGVFHRAIAAVRRVFHQLGDFNREAEENRRNLRHVIRRSRTAPQIAAVGVVRAGFASGIDLQRQAHVAAGQLSPRRRAAESW